MQHLRNLTFTFLFLVLQTIFLSAYASEAEQIEFISSILQSINYSLSAREALSNIPPQEGKLEEVVSDLQLSQDYLKQANDTVQKFFQGSELHKFMSLMMGIGTFYQANQEAIKIAKEHEGVFPAYDINTEQQYNSLYFREQDKAGEIYGTSELYYQGWDGIVYICFRLPSLVIDKYNYTSYSDVQPQKHSTDEFLSKGKIPFTISQEGRQLLLKIIDQNFGKRLGQYKGGIQIKDSDWHKDNNKPRGFLSRWFNLNNVFMDQSFDERILRAVKRLQVLLSSETYEEIEKEAGGT